MGALRQNAAKEIRIQQEALLQWYKTIRPHLVRGAGDRGGRSHMGPNAGGGVMGLFDHIEVPCPECGGQVLFQSKGAVCPAMDSYDFDDVTDVMRADLIGQCAECPRCGVKVEIKGEVKAWPEVKA